MIAAYLIVKEAKSFLLGGSGLTFLWLLLALILILVIVLDIVDLHLVEVLEVFTNAPDFLLLDLDEL
jgi:hypothetical protein